jgi:hypothetical protein
MEMDRQRKAMKPICEENVECDLRTTFGSKVGFLTSLTTAYVFEGVSLRYTHMYVHIAQCDTGRLVE